MNLSKTESEVLERLEEIKPVPPRNPQAALRGRAQFLSQAVSVSESQRHSGWKSIFRKEQYAMNLIVSILVIAGLLFGGGATVSAAHNDLPGEPLYGLKLWMEEVSLQLQNGPQEEATRLMELAQLRIQEMHRLTENGQPTPERVRLHLEQHINQALQLCSELPDAEMDGCLLQLRERLQNQYREMEQLMVNAPEEIQPIMEQTRVMLQLRLRLVEEGSQNHEMFRNTVRNGFRFGQEEEEIVPPVQNGPGSQNGHPTDAPAGPNADPSRPGFGPGEPNANPGGPNTDSGGNHNNEVGPNPNDNGGPDQNNGGPTNDNGGSNNDQGGNGSGGGGDTGGGGTGGGDTGGGGTGGGGTGGGGTGGGGTGGGSGG